VSAGIDDVKPAADIVKEIWEEYLERKFAVGSY